MKTLAKITLSSLAALMLGLILFPSSARAADNYYAVSSTGSSAWSSLSSWASDAAGTAATALDTTAITYFNTTANNTNGTNDVVFLTGATATGGIVFNTAGTVAINGGINSGVRLLTIGGNGITLNAGSGAVSFNGKLAFALGANQEWKNLSSNTLNLANAGNSINLNSNILTISGSGNTSLTGTITGAGSIVKSVSVNTAGEGALTFSGSNMFSGGVTLKSGTIILGNKGALGSGALTIAGGALDVTGAMSISAANTQNWNNDFTFVGSNTLNTGTGSVVMGKAISLNVAASTLVVSSAISGGYGLTKTGNGILQLDAANTMGVTTVNAGQVTLSRVADAGSGGVTVNTSGTAMINIGTAMGTGTLTLNAGSTLEVNANKAIGAGPMIWGGDFTFGGANGFLTSTGTVTLTNNVNFNVGGAYVQVKGIGGGYALTKSGNGGLVINGSSSYSGGTTLNSGTLSLSDSGALGTGPLTIAGGALDVVGAQSIVNGNTENWNASFTYLGSNPLNTGTGSVVLGTDINVTVAANTLTVPGVISGGFGLTKSGAGNLVLAGTNSYGGSTTISSGTLILGDGARDGALPNTNLVTNNGSLVFNPAVSGTFANNLSGSGTLTKSGLGAMLVSGSSSLAGPVNVAGGTLLNGSATTFNGTSVLNATNGTLDLNGFNASFATLNTSAVTGTVTNSSSTLATLNFTSSSASSIAIVAGNLGVTVVNTNAGQSLFAGTAPNTFTGGVTLLYSGVGNGTRLDFNVPITGTPFGTGTITMGQSSTDRAQIMLAAAGTSTINNPFEINTSLGSDSNYIFRVPNTSVLALGGTLTLNADVSLGQTGTTIFSGALVGNAGLKSGTGSTTIADSLAATTTVILNTAPGANTYSGNTLQTGTNNVTVLAANDQIPNGSGKGDVYVSGSLNLNGFTETINGLNSTSYSGLRSVVSGSGAFTVGDNNATGLFSGTVNGSMGLTKIGTGNQTITSAYWTGPTSISSGTLSLASGTLGGSITGSGALVKTGAGTLTLTKPASFSGPTIINAGTLAIGDGTIDAFLASTSSITNAGVLSFVYSGTAGTILNVNLNAGINPAALITSAGTVKGKGTVGSVSITDGGVLAPGVSLSSTGVGVLTSASNVTFSSGAAKLSIRLGDTTAGDSSVLAVAATSTVTLNGATLDISTGSNYVSPLSGGALTYLLIDGAAGTTYSGSFASDTVVIGADTFNVLYNVTSTDLSAGTGGGDVVLEYVPVPEPATWAMLVSGMGMLVFTQRLRRRSH